MTTLRRLLVAVYPIRVFLLALAAWSVAADVCAQSPLRVGYYDMSQGQGVSAQVTPIVSAGFTPVLLDDVSAAALDLADIDILFVQNPDPNVYSQEYLLGRAAIAAAVSNGMVLLIHDRVVANPSMNARVGDILPGVTNPASILAMKGAITGIDVTLPASTLVTNGPFGTITSMGASSLDGGGPSANGFVNITNVFFNGRNLRGLLHAASPTAQSATFSYAFGSGYVIYSTIPIDRFLTGSAPNPPLDNFRFIYTPNVLTYAGCGLRAFPAAVSATSATGHYGGTTTLTATVKCGIIPLSDATVTFTLNGTAVGSAQTNAAGTATLVNASLGSTPATAIPVGSYPAGVAATFAGTALSGAASGTAALTVEKAPASISFDGGTFVYDGTLHAATGAVTGVFGESLGAPSFSYTDQNGVPSDVAPVNAGIYQIAASSAETDNYRATTISLSAITITITPAQLTVAADDKTKKYGAAVPALTARFDGFVPGEGPGVLGGLLNLATDAVAGSPVAEYAITPSGLTSDNYTITFVNGTLAVTPADLTVRADDKSKIYGAALPPFTATYEGFVLGETPDVLGGTLALTTAATASSPVADYAISGSGLTSQNYTITFGNGTLAITPAALKVRADDKNKIYGAPLPALTVSYEGFVLGETPGGLAGTLELTTAATAGSPVADYAIHASGLTSSNYIITFGSGTLAVTPAALTVRADDRSKTYGAALPALTASYEGFVLGEAPGVLVGTLALTTAATTDSPVGNYVISAAGLTSGNYTIAFANGTLAVTPAALTIRADNKTKVYGAALPGLTAAFVGFVLGENAGVLGGALSLTTEATASSPVAVYPVSASGLTSTNYAIAFVNGTLAVTPAALKISARDQERLIGLPNPVLMVDYAGFVAGDTAVNLDVQPSVTTTAIQSSPAGTYPIVVRGALDSNYTIEHVNGTLTVSPEGRMHGSGFIDAGGARNRFAFDVRERVALGEKGSFTLRVDRTRPQSDEDREDDEIDSDSRNGGQDRKGKNDRKPKDDRFVSLAITSVVFSDNPDLDPNRARKRLPLVDTVTFTGVGLWNGVPALVEVTAADAGEPGAGRDTLVVTIRVAGKTVARVEGRIDGGNVQSNRLPRR
jgi:hypothetical protein